MEKDTIDELAFHIHSSLKDLVDYKHLFDHYSSVNQEAHEFINMNIKKVIVSVVVHASNHLIAAAYLYTNSPLQDLYGYRIFDDDQEDDDDIMFIPCPDTDCDRPVSECVCRVFAPIPLEELNPIERLIYIYLYMGDTTIDRVRSTAYHMTVWTKELDDWLQLFVDDASPIKGELNALKVIDGFLIKVPEHLAAIEKLHGQSAIIDVFGLGIDGRD